MHLCMSIHSVTNKINTVDIKTIPIALKDIVHSVLYSRKLTED